MKSIPLEEAAVLVAEGERKSSEERAKDVNARLRELVMYVKEHSPYFQRAYSAIGDGFKLTELPVTSKAGLMNDYESWVTDREITLPKLTEYLSDVTNASSGFLGRYTALSTSGSSGNPMPMVRDGYHNAIHGQLVAQRLLRGLDPHILDPAYTRIATIIAVDSFSSSYSSALKVKQSAGKHSDNFAIFSVLTPLPQIVERLNAMQPELVTGYPSSLSILANEKAAGNLSIKPKALVSSAELLSSEVYTALRQTFNCPVLNNYCSTEGGEIAMTCSEGHLHLNEDWIIIEPVDRECKPARPGNWSDAVLITDLTNYVQPIIRYYVNDSVRISPSPCKCGSNLPILEISGRGGDALSFNGASVTFPMFALIMLDKKGVLGWQFVQTGENTLEVRFSVRGDCDRSEIGNDIVGSIQTMLSEYGCGDVKVTTSEREFVRSTRGGKIPFTVKQFG